MANKKKSMQQIRQILQLHVRGKSLKNISRQLGLPRNTVKTYVRRWQSCAGSAELLCSLDDASLSALMLGPVAGHRVKDQDQHSALVSWLSEHRKELKRTGVTRKLLWAEYLVAYPSGYRYTQFCEYLLRLQKQEGAVYSFEHLAGEYLLIDFAGQTLSYRDVSTGQVVDCQVFVGVMPCSGHLYVEAVHTQRLCEVVDCVSRALSYFGGVPQCVLSDNLRSAVRQANRYEPRLTQAFEQLGAYYDCTFTATRAARPRDKANVERHVRIVYEQIFAPLRNNVFYSLVALNAAISRHLEALCHRPMQGCGAESRLSRFEVLDRPALRPLPARPFALRYNVQATVQRDYHILLGCDRHFYSVPFQHIGRRASVVYDAQHVEIYIDNQCVATHRRLPKAGRSTTPCHMPPRHQYHKAQQAMQADDYRAAARAIGPACVAVVDSILQSGVFYRQAFNSCLGILRLAKKFGALRLENACARAHAAHLASYTVIRNILNNNQDLKETEPSDSQIPEHHNIRGATAYA
jgi:transposase